MAAVIKIITNSYKEFEKEYADPRTADFMLMSSIWYPIFITGVYYYFVRHLGPQIMKDLPPFNLKNTLLVYNLIQVISNFCLFLMMSYYWIADDYMFVCEPVDKYYERHTMSVRFSWLYWIVKISDLLDTVFFILRKKDKQATFLHVYHHANMIIFTWIGVKFIPDGHALLLGLLNTAVHTVMYSYYLISNWNPKLITLRMKKTVTQMQMLQFSILVVQNTLGLFKEDCNYPKPIIMLTLFQGIFMLYMFYDFYRRAYKNKKLQ